MNYLFIYLTSLLLFPTACSDDKEVPVDDEAKVYPVSTLLEPRNDNTVALKAGSELTFSWVKPTIEGEAQVSYVLKIDRENGSFTSPLRTFATNQNTINLSHVDLDNLAGLAGIDLGATGTLRWAVSVIHGAKEISSPTAAKFSIKRLPQPKGEIPNTLYIYGEATEAGTATADALKFRTKSAGVFEIFTRIESSKPFYLIDTLNDEDEEVLNFCVENNTIKSLNKESKIYKTAVYRITLDFNTQKATFSEVTEFNLFFCIKSRDIYLSYAGKGKWASISLINFPLESWGDEKRYKFKMRESNGGWKFWEKSNSTMQESVITDQGAQLWDGIWGFADECKNKWCEVVVDMSGETYMHSIIPTNPNLDGKSMDWIATANTSTSSFVTGFWNTSKRHFNDATDGTISQYDYWPEAHAIEVVIDAYNRTHEEKYKEIIYNFYAGVRTKNGGNFHNSFYDDMAWHGLAHLRAFEATADARYETSAADLYKWVLEGYDEATGGIKWNNQNNGKDPSIPSTGPATIIAARRWVKYGEQEKHNGLTNLEWAKKLYAWIRNERRDSNGGIYENFAAKSGAWTYNTGTFIGAAVELYKITGEKSYLTEAIQTADWTLKNLSVKAEDKNILSDWAEQPNHDVNLFKGIFVRYFTQLIMVPDLPAAKRAEYIATLQYNAKALWSYASTHNNIIRYNYAWYFTPKEAYLRAQTSGCMLMEALALLSKEGFL